MPPPADRALIEALAALALALRDLGVPAMIIGGIAVIVRGVPRQTGDVDVAMWAEDVDVERLATALARHAIVPRIPDAIEFARQNQVLLLQHEPSGTPIEVSLAWLPFEREALARASAEDLGGVQLRVAAAEDLVVYKAVAWRDRDRADIERLLALHGPRMDLARVRALVQEFAALLGVPERARVRGDRVSRRARSGPLTAGRHTPPIDSARSSPRPRRAGRCPP